MAGPSNLDPSISLGVKPPNSLADLGSMVNVASGLQNFQQSQALNPLQVQSARQQVEKQGIELQKLNQANAERMAVQGFMANPSNWQDESGAIDMGKINEVIPKIAPLTGADHIQKLTTLSSAQTQARSAAQQLTQDQRAIVAGVVGPLGRAGVQNPLVYSRELANLGSQFPNNKPLQQLIQAHRTMLDSAQPGPAVAQAAIRASESMLSPESQYGKMAPQLSTINNGAAIMPAATLGSVGGSAPQLVTGASGASIPMQVSPSAQSEPTGRFDPASGAPTFYLRSASGQIIGEGTIPAIATAQAGAPAPGMQPSAEAPAGAPVGAPAGVPAMGMNPPPARIGNYQGALPPALESARQIQLNANQAAQGVPRGTFVNNQIIQLANDAHTGVGAQILSNLGGQFAALPWQSDSTTALNKLGHMIATDQVNLASSAGLNTDAARSLSAEANNSTSWTRPAIQSAARINRALYTGSDVYNRGINNAVAQANGNPQAARDFANRWASVADVNALRMMDLTKNQDMAGRDALIKELGGTNSVAFQRTMQKVQLLNQMVQGQ